MSMNAEPSIPALTAFDFTPRTRLVFGVGAVERVGALAAELQGHHVLLVTDRGLVTAGHAQRVASYLEAAGLRVEIFADAEENPTNKCVQKCAEFARRAGIDMIIGLGGGSSMDTAKGCNFILSNGGDMKDYWGIGKAKLPMLPFVAVPTTGGTGSECQSFALITNADTHEKMACGDAKAAARVAILDPALTLSQPPRVTACTGIDALTHAIESAVTLKRNAVSMLYSREAFALLSAGLPRVLKNPGDLEARGYMQLGAAWAGTAIENSMLGAAHSAANPLTAKYGIVHGQAVGILLPHVIRFNASEPAARDTYRALATLAHLSNGIPDAVDGHVLLARMVDDLLDQAGMPRSLEQLGVEASEIPKLAQSANRQWTAQFNPRPVTENEFLDLYAQAFQAPPDRAQRK